MGRFRGFLWLIAGVVVAVLAGGVAFHRDLTGNS